MASRLYRSTRALYSQVEAILVRLGLDMVGSPTTLVLMALYVTGLILLDARQTQTRITRVLPGRCHDALNRLLRVMPLSTRAIMGRLMRLSQGLGRGYLSVDDVIIEKARAKCLPWAGHAYSFAKRRVVWGVHIVVIVWCSQDGRWRIPIAFRLWRPKGRCAKHDYRTKPQLAETMLKQIIAAGVRFEYVVFDGHYTSGWLTKTLTRLGCIWVGGLECKTYVQWQGRQCRLDEVAARVRLKWRAALGLRALALRLYAPKYGSVRVVLARNHLGDWFFVASNDLTADLTTLIQRKRSRWAVETVFRDTKQFVGFTACQCWVDQATVRHVALVFLTFVVLQKLRLQPTECVSQVKLRWQLDVIRQGQAPPTPLKACPLDLRPTA